MRVGPAAALGGAVLAVGFVLLFMPSFAAALGLRFTFVTLLGVLALIQSLRFVQRRRRSPRRATETGDPERRYEAPIPGDDVDESLVQASGWGRYSKTVRSQLRSRLASAAVTAITAREGCSEDRARERVEAGTWTDDPVAAWFLGDGQQLPARTRARLLVARRSRFLVGFDRTVRAVASVAGIDVDATEGEG